MRRVWVDSVAQATLLLALLSIPEPLIEEAHRLLGFKSKTDTVVFSPKEMIRRKRIEELKEIMGSVRLEIDLPRSRCRPRRPS